MNNVFDFTVVFRIGSENKWISHDFSEMRRATLRLLSEPFGEHVEVENALKVSYTPINLVALFCDASKLGYLNTGV